MKNVLNLDYRTFKITFLIKSSNRNFIFQNGKELVYILKTFDLAGVESIKVLDKEKFKRVSKNDLLSFFTWDTETMEYLKEHCYFA